MNKLLDNLRGLGRTKLAALAGIAVAVLALMAAVALSGGASANSMLYSGLSLGDSAKIATALKAGHIRYRLAEGGHAIMVTPGARDQARLLLAEKNLPAGNADGFALFDHQNPLTGSSFLDRINETRAIDGSLERTITLIHGVRAARVQVVLPHRAAFSLTTQPARASVMLSLAGAVPLDQQSVNAILNLVASSVPGLQPDNITIADDRGELLASAGQASSLLLNAHEAAIRRQTERALSHRVRDLLTAAIGPGKARVVTTVSMNFDRTNRLATRYDPKSRVVRSRQTSDSTSDRVDGQDKTVSVQNNLPGAKTTSNQPKRRDRRNRASRLTNYEISKTVEHVVHAAPTIKRLSVAVIVDGVTTVTGKGAKAKTVWRPRSAATLSQLRTLVEAAIGYDKARGDVVDVQSLRFAPPVPIPAGPSMMARLMSSGALIPVLRTLVTGLMGLAALFLVFKPMLRKVLEDAKGNSEGDADAPRLTDATEGDALLETEVPQAPGLLGPAMQRLGAPSGLEQVIAMIEENPEASVTVLRDWLVEEVAA
ncbi:MAG: flagellar basal-body MS-ring/collar protein FliF [Acidiphilium sp.]